MPKNWIKYDKRRIIEAINDSAGNKTIIAKRVGCSRVSLDKYIAKYPEIAEALSNECEKVGDLVENKILQGIHEGNVALMIFYAKTKLKHRGYQERQEIAVTQPIQLVVDETDLKA